MNLSNYIPEIRCPNCFSYVSLDQSQEKTKLILLCENCGKTELPLEEYYTLIHKNSVKICTYCCKNFNIKEMVFNSKHKNFLCKKCFIFLSNKEEINVDDYSYFNQINKNCSKHRDNANLFFCENCQKHVCIECKQKEHFEHKIINIMEEAKKKNNIEELKKIIKKEEEEIELEQKYGENVISLLSKLFQRNAKNRKDILNFKKKFYLYFAKHCNDFYAYQNAEFLTDKINNPDFLINDSVLNELDEVLNNFDINYNINNKLKQNRSLNKNIKTKSKSKNKNKRLNSNKINRINDSETKKKFFINTSITEKKCSKKNSISFSLTKYNEVKMPNIYLKFNVNKVNDNLPKININIKNQTNQNNNIIISPEKNSELININNNDTNILFSQKFEASVVTMIYIGEKKILMSFLSPKENMKLININIIKEKFSNKNKENNIINLICLSSLTIPNKPIIKFELCENGDIISCSEEKIYLIKIINDSINIIKDISLNLQNDTGINEIKYMSCLSIDKENYLYCYNKKNKNENIISIICVSDENEKHLIKFYEFEIFLVEKISNDIFAFMGARYYKLIYTEKKLILKFYKYTKNNWILINKTDLYLNERLKRNEKPKNIIKPLVDNLVLISEPDKANFIIYNFQENKIIYTFICDKIFSMRIKIFENQLFLYNLEYVDNNNSTIQINSGQIFFRKYLIQRINNVNENRFNCINMDKMELKVNLNTNKIIDMVIIKDEKMEENGKIEKDLDLVFFYDDNGNVFYRYF